MTTVITAEGGYGVHKASVGAIEMVMVKYLPASAASLSDKLADLLGITSVSHTAYDHLGVAELLIILADMLYNDGEHYLSITY